jgi:hypothetical protein
MGQVKKITKLRTTGGDILTPEIEKAIAEEAEKGYDLSKARHVRVGRPSLGADAGKSPRVAFRIDAETYAAAKTEAQAESRTISSIARDALKLYVRRSAQRRLARKSAVR